MSQHFVLAVLSFPDIDPILFQIGPVAIRWYGLAYVAGLLLGWRYMVLVNRRAGSVMERGQIDDLLVWVAIGVVLGGRLGSVLFYNLPYYIAEPMQVFAVWRGGMSFHGGLIGVLAALAWFARRRDVPLLRLADLCAACVPIGLFFGRIANFINGELFGRASDAPWAMVFPNGGPAARHPSQLYEAGLEGAVLFFVLAWLVWRGSALARPGLVTGIFLIGYAAARSFVELFRQPDAHIGFLLGGSTMGQLLSLPMVVLGGYLVWRAVRTPSPSR